MKLFEKLVRELVKIIASKHDKKKKDDDYKNPHSEHYRWRKIHHGHHHGHGHGPYDDHHDGRHDYDDPWFDPEA